MTDYQPPNPGNSNPTPGATPPPPPPPPPPSEGYQQTAPIPSYPTNPGAPYQNAPYQNAPQYLTSAPKQQPVIDNTGVPAWTAGSTAQVGTTFFKALFDMSFRTFITRKLATVIYVIGLIVIGLGAVLMLLSGLAGGLAVISYSSGTGLLMIFGSLIGIPLAAIVLVIILRLSVEAGVALVAVAENTELTAANTKKH